MAPRSKVSKATESLGLFADGDGFVFRHEALSPLHVHTKFGDVEVAFPSEEWCHPSLKRPTIPGLAGDPARERFTFHDCMKSDLLAIERLWVRDEPHRLAQSAYRGQVSGVETKADSVGSLEAKLREIHLELKSAAQRERHRDEQFEQLQREVAELRAVLGLDDDRAPTQDAASRYLEEHPGEVQRFAGQHVAIHSERGIVAQGDSFEEVFRQAQNQGLADEVTFDVIANH